MNKISLILAMLIGTGLTKSQAEIVQAQCIRSITEIKDAISKIDPSEKTIAALDWDQTISSEEGNYELREGFKTTKAIIDLHTKRIKAFILTARLKGVGIEGGITDGRYYPKEEIDDLIVDQVNEMRKKLGPDWLKNGALKSNNLSELTIAGSMAQSGTGRELKAIMSNQIVFSGGNQVKGETMKLLIDQDFLNEKPDNIIFVDNALYNMDEVTAAFEDRPEKVYLFYYPNSPDSCDDLSSSSSSLASSESSSSSSSSTTDEGEGDSGMHVGTAQADTGE
ncbi:MAG: DUF2608 domain-containing protein [Candidatus Paracaedibacteraceae bacterium]|nr:DUF2608 domain-containing protein [Candidatus Paracaedibacteraceae bacterium]